MTGAFVSEDVVRIDLGDDEWVEIKAEMSLGDRDRLTQHYLRLQREPEGCPDTGRITLLCLNIVGWNLKRDGADVPINRETISQLRGEVADRIVDEINKRNKRSPKRLTPS